MFAGISAIAYHLPDGELSNDQLARDYPEWSIDKIEAKTGIRSRRIASASECASDLGVAAARNLFDSGAIRAEDIDFVLFCTQSPDFFLPTTACLIQDRLGIPTSAGALDFNLGCSGFVYGLGLAKGLVETNQARNVLLITAETYSKFLSGSDRSVRTIFGDGAAAVVVSAIDSAVSLIGPFVYGTDGRGADNLIVRRGGMREPARSASEPPSLVMAGSEIFAFTMQAVPKAVDRLVASAGIGSDEIDLYVFHQANRHMLDHLRRKLAIPQEKFCVELEDCGNTVSSTIPIALKRAACTGQVKPGQLVMLVGFGVGYSWGATLLRWTGLQGAPRR